MWAGAGSRLDLVEVEAQAHQADPTLVACDVQPSSHEDRMMGNPVIKAVTMDLWGTLLLDSPAADERYRRERLPRPAPGRGARRGAGRGPRPARGAAEGGG